MLNIIVCEDNSFYLNKNVNAINMVLLNYDIDYRIHKFDKYDNKMFEIINEHEMKKIYVLDINLKGSSGIDIALKIRENDFDSIIIFVSCDNKYIEDVFRNKLMVLDFICKCEGYEERLKEDINMALRLIYRKEIFVFKYNHTIYRVPYSNINYIEKEPLIKRCIIHTIDNNFYVVNSIERLNKILGTYFLRTHQSCIVNSKNIREIDCVNNKIIFNNGDECTLLTEKMKKTIKKCINYNNL